MRIGIYCGSFSPVHKGHIQIGEACLKQGLVDKLMIIATGDYWHKHDLLPLEDRLQMLEMVKKENMIIDHKYNHYPYTCQIFEQLESDHPEDTFILIIGGDNLPDFGKWRESVRLLTYEFIVIARDTVDVDCIHELMKGYRKENYTVLDIDNIEISSTYIREHLDDYEQIKDMIDPEVYLYLKRLEKESAVE